MLGHRDVTSDMKMWLPGDERHRHPPGNNRRAARSSCSCIESDPMPGSPSVTHTVCSGITVYGIFSQSICLVGEFCHWHRSIVRSIFTLDFHARRKYHRRADSTWTRRRHWIRHWRILCPPEEGGSRNLGTLVVVEV